MITRDDIKIECIQGDISKQEDMTAIVNAANAQLQTGGGVAGAIHRAAGPGLAEECEPMAPIKPGEAVISGAHELPNEYVIHCLGPVYGRDEPSDQLLADCYKNALEIAEEHEIKTIAFPAISTGAFGYPVKEAAGVAFTTIKDLLPKLESVKNIRFVLYSNDALDVHQQVMNKIFDQD
ncbi:macro domain-containing protein [Gracilimonas sp. Q87]|uniref:macro domain-containing protein n=1 Tax=Gracilimonas sp. Q87 TaxID=3384766 RepID=UPI0039844279